MVKFTIKCLLLASLFFFGVLYGIQEANHGMQDMQGTNHTAKIEQPQTASADVTISAKQDTLRNIQTFNAFSAAGDVASNLVTGLFRTGVSAATSILSNVLS